MLDQPEPGRSRQVRENVVPEGGGDVLLVEEDADRWFGVTADDDAVQGGFLVLFDGQCELESVLVEPGVVHVVGGREETAR